MRSRSSRRLGVGRLTLEMVRTRTFKRFGGTTHNALVEFEPGNAHNIACSNPNLCPICPSIKWRLKIHYYDSADDTTCCQFDRIPFDPTRTVAELREAISIRSRWIFFDLMAKDSEIGAKFRLYDTDMVKDAVRADEGKHRALCGEAFAHLGNTMLRLSYFCSHRIYAERRSCFSHSSGGGVVRC
jgi:hypothetical protein